MRARKHIVFLINLVQDVNMIRPLAYLAALELDVSIAFLVSGKFLERDGLRVWQRELGQIAADVGADIHIYETPADAFAVLQRKGGIIVAASESDLPAHAETHNVFRVAPPSFLKITLQHGYECVGFLQNREHIIAHGRNIKFGADVICGWCGPEALTSLAASERPKLYVSGAPTVLNIVPPAAGTKAEAGGLVCENLHSVRLRATGDFGRTFMDQFFQFCAALDAYGQGVSLRPHPGGMYVIKNRIELPGNVTLNSQPIYKIDLSRYGFGISAPSSVLLDMILAGIPVAVWRDAEGIMDASNYEGLTPISTLGDWFGFARDAALRRDFLLERQRDFLARIGMPTERGDVYRRFATLLARGPEHRGDARTIRIQTKPAAPRRIMVIAGRRDRALEQSLVDALAGAEDIEIEVASAAAAAEGIAAFMPDVLVCGSLDGPAEAIAGAAREHGVALVAYAGEEAMAKLPMELLKQAALVCCATERIRQRLRQLGLRGAMTVQQIAVAGETVAKAANREVSRIGYVAHGSGDLKSILTPLVRYLRRNTEVSLDVLGTDANLLELKEFGRRVQAIAAPEGREALAALMAERHWDIGLCPPGGSFASPEKWVAQSCAGVATIAAKDTAYEACCAEDRGVLVEADGWLAALEFLTDNPHHRAAMVERAQRHVEALFSPARQRAEILAMLAKASALMSGSGEERWPHEQAGPMALSAQTAMQRMGLH